MSIKIEAGTKSATPLNSVSAATALQALAQKVQSLLDHGEIPSTENVRDLHVAIDLTKRALASETKLSKFARVGLFFYKTFYIDPKKTITHASKMLQSASRAAQDHAMARCLREKHVTEQRLGRKFESLSDEDLARAIKCAHDLNENSPAPDEGERLAIDGLKHSLYRDKTGIYLVYNKRKDDPLIGKGLIKDVKFGFELLSGRSIARQTVKMDHAPGARVLADNEIVQLQRYANRPGQVEVLTASKEFNSKKGFKKTHVYMPLYVGTFEGFKERKLARKLQFAALIQAAEGVAFLHHQGRGHGDIKPDNFFLDERLHVHLGDYGTLYDAKDDKLGTSAGCTPKYVAPEYADDPYKPRELALDIYALGLVFFNCYYNSMEEYDTSDDPIKKLLVEMVDSEPDKRPTIDQVIASLKEMLVAIPALQGQ